MRKGDTSVEI